MTRTWCFTHTAPIPCRECSAKVTERPADYAYPGCELCGGTGKVADRICACVEGGAFSGL